MTSNPKSIEQYQIFESPDDGQKYCIVKGYMKLKGGDMNDWTVIKIEKEL